MFEQNEDMPFIFDKEESYEFQNNISDDQDTSNINILEQGNFISKQKENEDNLPDTYFIMTGRSTQEDDEKCEKICVNENENENNNIPIINSLKGRKKKPENELNENGIISKDKINNSHSKENDDNIRRKIKCHFHNFIIDFFNCLIKEKKKGNFKFKKIKYSYALNDTMKFNKILLSTKISDFFKFEISNKYKNYPKNENELVYEKLINRFDNESQKLFDLTYMEIYEKFYLNETFNNKSKLKNFYNLFEKERKKEINEKKIKFSIKESDKNKLIYSNLLKLIAEQRFVNYYIPNKFSMTKKLE
jgi:hypothetical protein